MRAEISQRVASSQGGRGWAQATDQTNQPSSAQTGKETAMPSAKPLAVRMESWVALSVDAVWRPDVPSELTVVFMLTVVGISSVGGRFMSPSQARDDR